jgi:hypothetical protein
MGLAGAFLSRANAGTARTAPLVTSYVLETVIGRS